MIKHQFKCSHIFLVILLSSIIRIFDKYVKYFFFVVLLYLKAHCAINCIVCRFRALLEEKVQLFQTRHSESCKVQCGPICDRAAEYQGQFYEHLK